MEQRRKHEALQQLKAARDEHQNLLLREENLKMDLDTLEADSTAAQEKLEMIQSRLKVAQGELRLVEQNILDTERGVIAQGKLPGLPTQTSNGNGKSTVLGNMVKQLMGAKDERDKRDGPDKADEKYIDVKHGKDGKEQSCSFQINASSTFMELVQNCSRYWDLPSEQCVMVSKDPIDMGADIEVWPNTSFVQFELKRFAEAGLPRPVFYLHIKPDDVDDFSEYELAGSSSSEEESETSKRRKRIREYLTKPPRKSMLKELLGWTTFVVLWLILLNWRRVVSDANLMVSGAKESTVMEEFTDDLILTYEDIVTSEEMYDWLTQVIQPAMYGTLDYNDVELPRELQYRVLYNGIPVGAFELKQYRVTSDSCSLSKKSLNSAENMTGMYYIPNCYDAYHGGSRDKSPFGPSVPIDVANQVGPIDDFYYATLDAADPSETTTTGCQTSFMRLPTGWSLASREINIDLVIADGNVANVANDMQIQQYADNIAGQASSTWGTECLVFSDGTAVQTGVPGMVECPHGAIGQLSTTESGHAYMPTACSTLGNGNSRILIRRPKYTLDDKTGFTFHYKEKGDYNVYVGGFYGSYPSAEAYVREVPYNDENAYANSLEYLQNHSWIDRATRAVVISILIYHPNFDSYVASQFMLERPPSGLFYPRFQFKVIKMDIFTNWFTDIAFMVIEIIIYTMTLYQFLAEIWEMKLTFTGFRTIRPYWHNIFNYADWLIIFNLSATIILRVGFYFNKIRQNFSPFKDLEDMDASLQSQQATKLQVLALAYDVAFQLDAILIMFLFFKFFKFFTLSPQLEMLWFTLGRAAKDLSVLTFMAALMMIGFASMANQLFGSDMYEFRSFVLSISTLLQILIGTFDYYSMEAISRIWAPIFFFIYVIFMYFIILNVFLAILNDSYLAEKKVFMIKFGDSTALLTNTRNVQDLARFAVLYMQDKQRSRKMEQYEKKRSALKEKQHKEEQEKKRKANIAEKKRKKAEKDAAREKQKEEDEAKNAFNQ